MTLARKIAIVIFLIIYIIAAVIVVIMHEDFETTVYEVAFVKSESMHGTLMLAGIISMGFALFTYRLLRGTKTRTVKYIHLIFHTIAIVFFVAGYFFTDDYKARYAEAQQTFMNSSKTNERVMHLTSFAHITVGYLFLGCLALQYVVALCIFVWMYENKKMRLYFAPFHDIIGIWLFLCYVGTYLTGIYFLFESHVGFLPSREAEVAHDKMHILTIPTYICFLIVLGVVLSPHFEWELVGPL